MSTKDKNRVCPVENAGALDLGIRKLFHSPKKILKPYIKSGMTVLDTGCGPGYFTIEMAKMTGTTGKLIAADLQEGMLEKVKAKINNTIYQNIVELHLCEKDRIGLSKEFDFILIFYMLHEVPNPKAFLQEIKTMLKPEGKVLIVEPKFHVTKDDFKNVMEMLKGEGFEIKTEPKIFFSRAVVISKS